LAPADPPFDEAAEPDRLRSFVEEIETNGFKRVGAREWQGPTPRSLLEGGHTTAEKMTIIVRPAWPYLPPLLHVPGIGAWHADQEKLCIWQADDNSQRWVTLQGLYERIDEWAEHAAYGFAEVENARNPEIYWQDRAEIALGLVNLDELLGRERGDGQNGEFHFCDAISADGRPSPASVFDLRPGPFTAVTSLPSGITDVAHVRGRWFYRSSVPHPPRTLQELNGFLTQNQRKRLEKDLRDRPVLMFGLFWHNQAGLVSTMLLATRDQTGQRSYRLLVLRPKGRDALLLRAGPDAHLLQQVRIAILGVGAIGSHVAEQLARAGVSNLRLIDYDLLWPANLIRHAAPPGTPAATPKTAALRDSLSQYPWVHIEIPDQTHEGCVWTLNGLREILQSTDLTIDATGHTGLAELGSRVGFQVMRPYISVALFRGGTVARVRRQARANDTPFLQRVHLDGYPVIPPLDEEAEYVGTETGCLARIHNAPPVSVAHAAVLAVEVALDHLTARYDQPDEIIEVLRPGDPPFDQVGRLRPEDLPVTLDVSERAQLDLREASLHALPDETGGILLGCVIDGRPVVSEVVQLRDGNATPCTYRVPEGRTTEEVANAKRKDSRVGYIGEWHSHVSEIGPSTLDTATMFAVAQDSGTESPILVLVHPNEPRPTDLAAYTTTRAGLKHVDICTTGDLPPAREHHPTPASITDSEKGIDEVPPATA
jgi:hypothetical protein